MDKSPVVPTAGLDGTREDAPVRAAFVQISFTLKSLVVKIKSWHRLNSVLRWSRTLSAGCPAFQLCTWHERHPGWWWFRCHWYLLLSKVKIFLCCKLSHLFQWWHTTCHTSQVYRKNAFCDCDSVLFFQMKKRPRSSNFCISSRRNRLWLPHQALLPLHQQRLAPGAAQPVLSSLPKHRFSGLQRQNAPDVLCVKKTTSGALFGGSQDHPAIILSAFWAQFGTRVLSRPYKQDSEQGSEGQSWIYFIGEIWNVILNTPRPRQRTHSFSLTKDPCLSLVLFPQHCEVLTNPLDRFTLFTLNRKADVVEKALRCQKPLADRVELKSRWVHWVLSWCFQMSLRRRCRDLHKNGKALGGAPDSFLNF